MYAFITKSKGRYILEIRTSCDLSRGESVTVLSGLTKAEARKLAQEYHAQPWNF
jgi:hypothetical protein